MKMLDAILEKVSLTITILLTRLMQYQKIRLMDYELLKDQNGHRLVQFGLFAGYAGLWTIVLPIMWVVMSWKG